MNYLHGALGSGNRANAAIGRALRLCARNVGGSVPGGTDRATQGGPHRMTMNFAENEDASPWDSLAVEYGFEPTDDVATLMAMSGGPATIADERSRDGRGMAGTLAASMSCMQDPKSPMVDTLVVLSPDHAGIFGRSGWSKDDVRECIMEETAIPLKHRLRSDDAGAGLPPSVVQRFGGEAALDHPVPKFQDKSNIILVVAGSAAAKILHHPRRLGRRRLLHPDQRQDRIHRRLGNPRRARRRHGQAQLRRQRPRRVRTAHQARLD